MCVYIYIYIYIKNMFTKPLCVIRNSCDKLCNLEQV